ncbi:hypothetical protein AHAS_Ahas11G0249600 [Arachis hypogaea]
MNSDSKEDFKTTYEAGDKDDNSNGGGEKVMKNVVVPLIISQLMDVPPFMHSLDLDAMHVPKFFKYTNIGVIDPEDREFRIGMKYKSRKSIVATIRSYTIYMCQLITISPSISRPYICVRSSSVTVT